MEDHYLLNDFMHWLRDEGWIKPDLLDQAVDITVTDFLDHSHRTV